VTTEKVKIKFFHVTIKINNRQVMNQLFEELSVTVMSFKLFYYNSIRACN
jgi:hypothetical protein